MKKIIGISLIAFLVSCNPKEPSTPDQPANNAPKNISYSIVNTYPHDTSSYTQGLLIYNGVMYEGTGNYAKSKLRKIDYTTGKPTLEISLEEKYFGEGITILNDTVYQLTWKEKKVFVYTLKDFKRIKEFEVAIEGWGLTNDGKNLIVSTGSGDLNFYEPSTFKLLKTQTVIESGSPSFNLNELEYIDGYIYANQYEYPYILKIDPANGVVVGKIDLTKMWERIISMRPGEVPSNIVPNGIAYDAITKKIYITGKFWPELYEVQFSQ